jgi:hypothetical protein
LEDAANMANVPSGHARILQKASSPPARIVNMAVSKNVYDTYALPHLPFIVLQQAETINPKIAFAKFANHSNGIADRILGP